MAERIAYLEAVVGADITQFRKGMRDIRNETGILSESLQGLAGIGRSLTFSLTTPLITLGTYFAEAATTFDANMRNINSLVHLTQEEFQKLSTETLNFGMNTRAGANAASEALYAVFSAGYGLEDTAKAMALLEQSTLLSEAGLSDLTRTTEGLTATMASYAHTGLDVGRATDVWAQMVAYGVGNLEGFLQNANKTIPASSALGISFENLGAAAAFLSQGFASPNKAMTALGMLESNLMKPNKALMAAYIDLGVTTGKELVAKFGSLEEAIIAVKEVTNDTTFAASFSKTGMEAALMLTNNIDGTRKAMQDFYATLDGAALGQWQQQIQSFAYQFDRFKSALQGVAIALGSQILPLAAPFIGMISDGLVWFAQLNPEVHRFTVILGAIAAAVGPVLWVFGSLIGTLTPLGLIFKGIIAAGAAFASNFMGIRDTVVGVAGEITGSLQPLIDTINTFYETLFPDTLAGPSGTDTLTGNWVQTVDSGHLLKIDGPTNLWTIFEEQGYGDLMSWDDFKKRARGGGWDGQALDVGDIIDLDAIIDPIDEADQLLGGFGNTIQKTKSQMELMMNGGLVDPSGPVTPSTFVERFRNAITTALPAILTEFGNLLSSIRAWADDHIGTGLLMLSSIFSGANDSGGRTPIFEAVKMALNGDLIGAIDAVIPGAGDHLRAVFGSDFGQKIKDAFPQISAGITDLLANIANWLQVEGIPTLSRSVGYLVGKIGVEFGRALGALGSYITGGGAAKGVGAAGMEFGNMVIDPLMGGLNEAMAEGGVANPVDALFTALGGALVTAAGAWVIGVGFSQGVFAAIKFALSGMLNISLWAGGWALTLLGKLATALAIKSGLAAVWSSATTAVSTGISTALSAAMSAITSATSWVVSGALGIVKAIGLAIAASPISAGIVIGTLLYMAIPESVKTGFRNMVTGVIDELFGAGTTSYLNDAVHDAFILAISAGMLLMGDELGAKEMAKGLSGGTALQPDIEVEPEFWADGFNIGTEQGRDDFLKAYFPEAFQMQDVKVNGEFNFEGMKASIDEQYLSYFSPDAIANAMAQGITWDEYTKQIDAIAIKAYDLLDAQLLAAGAEWTMPDTLPAINMEGIDIAVSGVTINTEGATVTLTDPTTLTPTNGEEIVTYITPDGKMIDERMTEANTQLSEGMTTFGTTIAANIGDGSTLDANTINENFLKPLEAHFVNMFGPEGMITLTLTNFGVTLGAKFGEYGTHLATANTVVATELGKLTLSFTTEFEKIALAIQSGLDKITDWNLAAGGMVGAPATAGGMGVDGSHAGGLRSVPHDGYIAKLHKKERVLTAQEAEDYDNIPRSALVSGSSQNSGGNSTTQTVVFNEAMSVDRTIRELNRRGYRLEKR